MPKLYEYRGLIVFFYSDEHEPVHVHGTFQGRESKAEIIIVQGRVVGIRYGRVSGMRPLGGKALRDFKALVEARAGEIVEKWIDYFVRNRSITPQKLARRIR
ncbi:MAG: DUF4160 domain-containing protein [Planctomycetota bacterium]|nr:DUF4160 domain-containing protein [Planctomycetota bacterium]